ncbi:unnamed protein product [Sphagnum troendelagicum]
MDGNNVVLAGSGSCEHDDGQQQFSKRQRNHRREPGEATQGACFIKTMVDSNLPLDPDCWMRIPCAFVKQHGHSFKDRAMLEGANGQRWPVGIGGAFDFKGFMEGWRPFAAYHCLVKGDQLVFTLVGHSQFAVQGFDKNGCSKKGTAIVCTICSRRNALTAPANRSVVGKLKCTISKRYEKVEKKAADTVVMMVNKQQCSSAIPKLEIPREQQVKSEHHVVNDLGSIKTQESLGCIPKPASPRRQRRQQRCSPTGKLPPSSPPSPAAVKTTNPSFKIMMKKTHVAQPFYHLPEGFSKMHAFLKRTEGVLMDLTRSRRWPVKWRTNSRGHLGLGQGWKSFACAHDLQEGDVCVFELVDLPNLVLLVHVFQVSRIGNSVAGNSCPLPELPFSDSETTETDVTTPQSSDSDCNEIQDIHGDRKCTGGYVGTTRSS